MSQPCKTKLAHKAARYVEDSIVGLRDFRGAFYSSSQVERRSNLVDPVGMDRLCQQTIGLLVKARRSGGHGEGIGDRKKTLSGMQAGVLTALLEWLIGRV